VKPPPSWKRKDWPGDFTTSTFDLGQRFFQGLTEEDQNQLAQDQVDTQGSENALLKLLYAGMLKASEKWTHPVQNWNLTLLQLSIHFEGRIDEYVDL
jgi:hypothetical protein